MVAARALVFRLLVKGNEDSGNEIVTYHNVSIRFDAAEIRRLNRCRISVG